MRHIKLSQVCKSLAPLPLAFLLNSCQGVAILDPKGPIGIQERDLIAMAVGLGMIVIIPVVAMALWFTFRYRESNKKATYTPHWEGSLKVESVIWVVPILIIAVLSYLTLVKTTELDPYKPIASTEKAVHVQVVSLDWNWLFIYPDYKVASLNSLVIPSGVPVTFDMTSSTVMTSLFIPHLGSQMYIMAGMVSHLNLLANEPGSYPGHNMEYSGKGYDSMSFVAKAVTKGDFEAWTQSHQGTGSALTAEEFQKLKEPKAGRSPTVYGSVDPELFTNLVAKFMPPPGSAPAKKMDDSAKM